MEFVSTPDPVPEAERLLGRYRLLTENMRDLAIFVDGRGRIVEVNAAAARTYGIPAAELVGTLVSSLCVCTEGCAIQETLRSGEPRTCACVHRRPDGTLIPVEVSATQTNIDGEPIVLCIIR